MSQKRVLVVGSILLAAGIGAPTTAFLVPGGVLSDPQVRVVEEPAPKHESVVPAPSEPADLRRPKIVPSRATAATTVTTPKPARPEPSRTGVVQPVRPEPPRDPRPPSTDDGDPPPRVIDLSQPDTAPPVPLPSDDRDTADQ
jgi:hypothetical protein